MPQFSGLEVDFNVGEKDITAKKVTIDITDNTKAATSRGVPDGTLKGGVEGTVTIEMDTFNFKIYSEAAKKAGSWRAIEPFDLTGYMKKSGSDLDLKVDVYGLKPKLSTLLDVDTESEDALVHKVEHIVTSPDFVHIDGIPYLDDDEIKHISS
ncbi:DUF2597 family protein [Vibrio parahaemolyticus]|nr:DUF2597 family protein [Vibrio parahaemolyticus]